MIKEVFWFGDLLAIFYCSLVLCNVMPQGASLTSSGTYGRNTHNLTNQMFISDHIEATL